MDLLDLFEQEKEILKSYKNYPLKNNDFQLQFYNYT